VILDRAANSALKKVDAGSEVASESWTFRSEPSASRSICLIGIQKYELGMERISINRLEQIAAALDMSVTEFLTPQTLAEPTFAQTIIAPAPLDSGTWEAFLRMPEARTLVEAFSAIDDQRAGQQIIELVGTLSRLVARHDGKDPSADP
jgi:transcriptional regulator with XRE-family HTH domain